MLLQNVISKNTYKKLFLVAILKVTDENSRIESRMDPRIRIRANMSRIRNNGLDN